MQEPITPPKEIIFNPSYTQQNGAAYLGDSLKLIKFIDDNSINLIITSPPFALTRKKEYGNETAEKYIANTESNSAYLRRCKAAEIRPHPARFLQGFAEFFVKFLTDEGDMVLDPFAGSNTSGFVAQTLQRRWISFEINEDYVMGSRYRFTQ